MNNTVNEDLFKDNCVAVKQDWKVLQQYLRKKGQNLDIIEMPNQFAAGYGNLNYYINFNGRPAVLRRPPMNVFVKGANDMLREAKVLNALSPVFSLVPECLFVGTDLNVWGVPFLIMEYRPGITLKSTLPDHIENKCLIGAKLTEELLNILISLHSIDPSRIGLGDLGRAGDYFSRTAKGWLKRANAAWGDRQSSALAKIEKWLSARIPKEGQPVILHNDFKLDNIILESTSLQPKALIDWDLGTRGDAMWDFAVLLSYWAQEDDPLAMLSLQQMPTLEPGFPKRDELIAQYAERTKTKILDILPYKVLAQFRLAVVFQQIFLRYEESEDRVTQDRQFDKLALGLLDFTLSNLVE